ncbi:RHS repeat-associated core domain-containing protein, partial [Pseudomonas sp. RIT-PI-S]|uniref:RHS repeat domain-containing protein n=1 Tax=Pseudomonas sp. RIT-PI-S TaxID=3035295 RepID=UPI0021DB730D
MANENIHTNAQNFPSFASGGVDPRTGLYTFSLALPSIISGELSGPEFSLALMFNPIGGDNWGLGAGWSTNLSHVHLSEPRMLKLSTGEQFRVDGSGSEPGISERKLPSFRYLQHSPSAAQIIHRTGAVEHLSNPGVGDYLMPHMLQGPTGHALHLTYESDEGRPRLSTIKDDHDQVLLQLIKTGTNLIRIITPSGELAMNFANGRLRSLDLPEDVGGAWAFEYTGDSVPYANITQVTQPLGAIERLTYDGYHLVPGNGMPNVPRVSRHEVDAGPGSAVMVSQYRYGDDNHNFLGFGGVNNWQSDGTDNLYRASPDYTYSVVHIQQNDDETRTTTRVYNSFHLLISETTQQGQCITERTTQYHLKAGAAFEAQPPQFQLPSSATTRWRIEGQAKARVETTTTEFDVYGNLTYQRLPTGQETEYTYYPAAGETDAEGVACPADPWGFVRHYRTITVRPARKPGDLWFDDVTVTTYRHGRVECVSATPGKPTPQGAAIQAVSIHTQSTRGGVTAHHEQAIEYYHSPASEGRHQHGRIKTLRETLWQAATPEQRTTSVEQHRYEKTQPTAERALGSRLRTHVQYSAHDGCGHAAVREQDLASGLTLWSKDTEGTEVVYVYDALQRLISACVQDPEAPAERTFAYHHSGNSGLPEAEQTSAVGVTTRTVYDRLGREIQRHRSEGWQAGERPGSDGGLYWEGRYDAFGRLVEEIDYDDCGNEGAVVSLSRAYEYDDWGQVKATLLPDGTRQVSETSPFGEAGPITTHWLESIAASGGQRAVQGKTRTELGIFGKPVLTEVMLAEGNVEQRTRYTYDGWGQCIEQTEQFRLGTTLGTPQRTLMRYDPWGRVEQTTQPNNDVFGQGFAAHSREAWVTQLNYAQYGAPNPSPVLLAQRTFDGLGRVTEQTQGGRTQRYSYDGASPSPSQVRQADGQVIHYTYKPALTSSPLTVQGGGMNFRYGYDLTTAQLLAAEPTDAQGQALTHGPAAIANTYRYSRTGQLLEDLRTDQGQTYTTHYRHSFAGRRVNRTDLASGASRYHYDSAGRLHQQHAEQGAAVETATLTYDSFGQVYQRTCGAQTTESTYDSLGRETERRTLRDGSLLRRYTHAFNGNGHLAKRLTFNDTDQQVLCETFVYDVRNRLIEQANEGSPKDLPHDSFGQPLAHQLFEFDALDNLTAVLSTYANGEMRVTEAYFEGPDPCQLSRLMHTHIAVDKAVKTVEEETFTYDANGRLEGRSSGWQLSYDAFGRLASLSQPGAARRRYRYDPQGSLCAVDDGSGDQQRFYDGLAVDHLRRGAQVQRYLTAAGIPLAMLQAGEAGATALLTDRNGSVTGEWRENTLHAAVYDAYGNSQGAEPLSCELGFNGELREGPGSDLYLLGRGYRLYDATLMRFLAPDDASPFDEGGLNPYAYCRGNPVMLSDPTGHMPQWTASNLPYYVPPPEMQQQEQGGGWLSGILKTVGWLFIGYEAFSLLKLGFLAATAATGGLVAVGAAAAGVVALGVGVASMLDEDNEALTYAAIGLGVFSGMASNQAFKALKAGRAVGAARGIGTGITDLTPGSNITGDLADHVDDLGLPRLFDEGGPPGSANRRASTGAV